MSRHRFVDRLLLLALVTGGCLSIAATDVDGKQTVWYVVRSAGVVSYLLLTSVLALGLVLTTPLAPTGDRRYLSYALHRFLSALTLCFSTVHAVALLLDRYVGFSPVAVFVPFMSEYRRFGVGLGILTLYLFAAIYASFWLRRRIGFKAWRVLHYAGFVTFTMATYHGVLVGTDSTELWLLALYGEAGAIVLLLAIYRLIAGEGIDERQLRMLETARASRDAATSPD